ncbi:MAG: hypothetical protein GXX85_15955 [Ignavibacteria bacterium]|nr:hypothetical protein [Ignavibacteria bacterium]
MKSIEGKWAGRIYGTNTGNMFCDLKLENDQVNGTARLNDDAFGLVVFSVSGKLNTISEIKLTQFSEKEVLNDPAIIDVKIKLQTNGNIIGEWISKNGHAGTLELFPHKNVDSKDGLLEPRQIFSKSIKLGSLRLFRKDIEEIVKYIKKDFPDSRLIVSYNKYGSEIIKFADDFINELDEIKELNGIQLSIQDVPSNQLNRGINIDLFQRTDNEIRISGPNDSWVLGKAESVKLLFSQFTNKVITNYKKYGLTLNSLIFFLMLILIPEIDTIIKRSIFVGSVIVLLSILYLVHKRFIPNTVIFLTDLKPSIWKRMWPSILSWIISVTSALFASWLFYYLTN